MKIRECSRKVYKRWLMNDVALEISSTHQCDVFCALSEESQKEVK